MAYFTQTAEAKKAELMSRECRVCEKAHLAAPVTIQIEIIKQLSEEEDAKTATYFHTLQKYFATFQLDPSFRTADGESPIALLESLSEKWSKVVISYSVMRQVVYEVKLFIDMCAVDLQSIYNKQLRKEFANTVCDDSGGCIIPTIKIYDPTGKERCHDNTSCTPRR